MYINGITAKLKRDFSETKIFSKCGHHTYIDDVSPPPIQNNACIHDA